MTDQDAAADDERDSDFVRFCRATLKYVADRGAVQHRCAHPADHEGPHYAPSLTWTAT